MTGGLLGFEGGVGIVASASPEAPPTSGPAPASPYAYAIPPAGGMLGFEGGFGIVASASTEATPTTPPPSTDELPGPGDPPPDPSYSATFLGAVASWLASKGAFHSVFLGGLHYDAAPADPRITYPYVVFAQHGSRRKGVIGRPSWSEDVEVTFQINASGDLDIDALAVTLESILFSPRGAGHDPIPFTNGRCLHRRGGVKSIGLARAMGVGGVDVFQATIDSTWLVARDS